jgi:RNA polymerase sigma-70 factor (ECF subfamily)
VNDAELIQRARQGDASAWEPLVQAHQESVFRLSYLLLGDTDDAQDVAQETFLRAYRSLHLYDASRPLRPWILSIAANLSRNRRRAAGRYLAALRRLVVADPPDRISIEEKSAQNMEAQSLWEAVQRLDEAGRQVVDLRYFLALSVEETAEVLGVAAGTVKSRLHRALSRLRSLVKDEFPALVEGKDR